MGIIVADSAKSTLTIPERCKSIMTTHLSVLAKVIFESYYFLSSPYFITLPLIIVLSSPRGYINGRGRGRYSLHNKLIHSPDTHSSLPLPRSLHFLRIFLALYAFVKPPYSGLHRISKVNFRDPYPFNIVGGAFRFPIYANGLFN